MASQVDVGKRPFTAAGAIARYLRVKDNGSGKLVVAVAADGPGVELGEADRESFAVDNVIGVRLTNHPGTRKMVAAGAIGAFVEVFADAAGKVGVVGTNPSIGISMEAAAADLDIIEVMRT